MKEFVGSIVITGASKGIGRACAQRFDRLGYRVFAGVRRDADADALRVEGSERMIPILIDVTDPESISGATKFVGEMVGDRGILGLVNNAGIAVAGPLEFLPLAELRRQLDVNVVGQVAVTQAFLPWIRREPGRIVFMGSISGLMALPFTGAYAASKHALEAIADALRVELLPWGIEVSIVEPGVISTPIWRTSIATAERILGHLPKLAFEYYGAEMEAVRETAHYGEEHGLPADEVARVVEHAITARRPKPRYLVGRDARLRAAIRHLPDRWRDRLIRWRLDKDVR